MNSLTRQFLSSLTVGVQFGWAISINLPIEARSKEARTITAKFGQHILIDLISITSASGNEIVLQLLCTPIDSPC